MARPAQDGARSASCRCGSSATSTRRPRASASSACSTARNAGLSNLARFKLPEFDRLYEQARSAARRPRAHEADAADVGARRAYAPWNAARVSLRERPRASVGARLQVQRVQPASVAVPRRRHAQAPRRARVGRIAARSTPRWLPARGAAGGACCASRVRCAARARRSRRAQRGAAGPTRRRCCASTFPVAETGFDPQATSDYYSVHVKRAIFEPLYAYDYLARPYRIVPNTAAAMPEISADGRTWTIRIKPGIYFADDPAFKGRKRELDRRTTTSIRGSACSTRGCARRSSGSSTASSPAPTPVLAKAKAGRAGSTTTRRSRACARSTATRCSIKLERARLRAAGLPDAAADGGRRARGDRGLRRRVGLGDGESGRHRPVTGSRSGGAGRRSCSRRIPTFARVRFPRRGEPGGRGDARADEGQAAAADRPRRDLDHRGVESAAARVRQRRARLSSTCPPTWSATCSTPGNTLKPELRDSRACAARARSAAGARVHVLQHGRPGRRRLHAGQDRAAPRDDAWASTPTS